MTALHIAAAKNDAMVVKVLLNMKEVDANAVNVRAGVRICAITIRTAKKSAQHYLKGASQNKLKYSLVV